jgi:hypothetical protein
MFYFLFTQKMKRKMETAIGILRVKLDDVLGRQHDASILTAYIDYMAH